MSSDIGTIAFDNSEKIDILIKENFNVASTNENTQWYLEKNAKFNTYINGADILIDEIPSTIDWDTAQDLSASELYNLYGLSSSDFYTGGGVKKDPSGIVHKFIKLKLEPIQNSNVSGSGIKTHYSYYLKKTVNGKEINILENSFQQNFGDGISYNYSLQSNSGISNDLEIYSDSNGGNWFFNFKNGIVFVPDPVKSTTMLNAVNENNPPYFTFVKYVGRKGLVDEIVVKQSKDEIINPQDKQIVIQTSDNTIHRYDSISSEWVGIGGSGGTNNSTGTSPIVSTGSDYSQISNYDVMVVNDGSENLVIPYVKNDENITGEWKKLVDIKYTYVTHSKKILISYDAFLSFNNDISFNNIQGFGGKTSILEWVFVFDNNIISNSKTYVELDLIEKYANTKTIINFTDDISLVDISKNLFSSGGEKQIQIYARSLYDNSLNWVKLHQTQFGTSKPDNFEIISIGDACPHRDNKNILDYKTYFTYDVSESIISYSNSEDLNGWKEINFINDYIAPKTTKDIIFRFYPFLAYTSNSFNGIRGKEGVIEFIFKFGDIFLHSSRQMKHLGLIEKYVMIETMLTFGDTEDLSNNIIKSWNDKKSIKIFARSIYNSDKHNVKINKSGKKSQIQVIAIGGCISDGSITQNNTSSSTTTSSDDRIKHNETNISNAINIINKLQPKKYIKTKQLYNRNHNFRLDSNGVPIDNYGNKLNIDYSIETGLIAQDLLEINELSHVVNGHSYDINGNLIEPKDKPLNVKYNDIFVYTLQALKELIQKNNDLENKVLSLENKLNL
jgi:hypothetical protein